MVNGDMILHTQEYPTRIEAQHGAEELLREFCEGVLKVLDS